MDERSRQMSPCEPLHSRLSLQRESTQYSLTLNVTIWLSSIACYWVFMTGSLAQEVTKEMLREGIAYTAIDLYKYSHRGHLQQVGPMLSPGAPGWGRHSRSTFLSGAFRAPEEYKGKVVSWIEGRGGTINFPISESERQLEELLIWLHPIAPHQVVSIFVDETLIKNLSLSSRGRYYRLKLPRPLERGEHSLRLYFRITRPASWGGRTPGAIGPLSFVPKGQTEQMLDKWTGEVIYQQQKWGALFAPPPSTWRFYFIPPIAAEFKTTLYLPPYGPSTRFTVYITSDEMKEKLLLNKTLSPGRHKEAIAEQVSVSLDQYQGKPIRLTLTTQKVSDHPLSKQRQSLTEKAALGVGWLAPRVDSLYPPPHDLPKVRRLLVWAIDGLKLDIIFQQKELLDQLPSLKILVNRGVNFSRLWSDEASQRSGHLSLLQPLPRAKSILKHVKDNGGWSAYIGSTLSTVPVLDERFDSLEYVDPQEIDQNPFRALLMQVQQMSKLSRILDQRSRMSKSKDLELIYIHSPHDNASRRSSPFPLSDKELKWIEKFKLSQKEERRWIRQLRQLKEIDYCLAQLLSSLSMHELYDETAVLITGTVGLPPKLTKPAPHILMSHVETSAILFHPHLKGAEGYQVDGANLSSLSETLLTLMTNIEEIPQGPPQRDDQPISELRGSLAPFIINHWPLPAVIDNAMRNAHYLSRLNDYYLLERPIGQPILWRWPLDHSAHPLKVPNDLSQEAPILLRTMRDGLSVSSLLEGLR